MKLKLNNWLPRIIRTILKISLVMFAIAFAAITLVFITQLFQDETVNPSNNCNSLMVMKLNKFSLVLKSDLLQDCEFSAAIRKTFMQYSMINAEFSLLIMLLVLYQLHHIFGTFPKNVFREPKNPKRIRYIALLLLGWVLIDAITKGLILNSIPKDLIFQSHGPKLVYGISNTRGVNLQMLFVAIVVYSMSMVFSKGISLQDETSLTV